MRIANLNERGDEPEKGSSRRRSRSMWTFSTREVMTIAVVILLFSRCLA